MHDRRSAIARFVEVIGVGDVAFDERSAGAVEVRQPPIRQIVECDDFSYRCMLGEMPTQVRADKPGSASDNNFHTTEF